MSGEPSHLSRRRAMAEILANVYEVASERYGKEQAARLLAESVKRSAIDEGREFAQTKDSRRLDSFAEILGRWTKDGALEIELLASTETELSFNVVRCRYAEMYRSMGLAEIGPLLSCNRDAKFCQGFNPEIELTRTQTLMEGATYCDFRFSLNREPSKNPQG